VRTEHLVRQSTILLGDLPRMMRSIVESTVAAHADLRLADAGTDVDLEHAVDRCGADVLIVGERPDRSEAFYRPLLLRHPSLKVFILTQDGRNVTLMGFRRVRLPDASPNGLIEAIRSELHDEAAHGGE
jgi:hypothetical protein